jgi:hypothetical protein
MKRVSINDIVTEAIEEMGLDNNMVRPLFLRWATECSGKIGGIRSASPCSAKRTVSVDTFELPDEAIALYPSVQVVDDDFDISTITKDFYEMLFYPLTGKVHSTTTTGGETVVYQDTSRRAASNGWLNYRIDDGTGLLANQSYDGKTVLVSFLKYKTDSDGMIKVHESESSAIRAYIKWMYASRSQFGSDERKIAVGVMDRLEDEYHRLVRRSVGKQSSEQSSYANQSADNLAISVGHRIDLRDTNLFLPGGQVGLLLFE